VPAILQRAQVLAFQGRTDEALGAVDSANRIEPDAPRDAGAGVSCSARSA
jgi:hypothetical protein